MIKDDAAGEARHTAGQGQVPSWIAPLTGVIAVVLTLKLEYDQAMEKTGGVFVYGLDDAYIHLSMARTLASHHVWGLTPDAPASASSSPLWTALLAVFTALPIEQVLLPFIVNSVLAIAGVLLIYRLARNAIPNAWIRAGAAVLTVLAIPAPAMVLSGMENLLHALLAAGFVWLLVTRKDSVPTVKTYALWACLGVIMAMTRYESMFLFVVPAVWGLVRKKWILTAPIVGGAVAIVGFGLLSLRSGLPFIPATLLLKTGFGDPKASRGFLHAVETAVRLNVERGVAFDVVALAGIIAAAGFWKPSPRIRLAAATVLVALSMHVLLASTRRIYRYEAYLIAAIAMLAILAFRADAARKSLPAQVAAALVAVALAARAVLGFQFGPQAVQNIHDQQFLMGKFLAANYQGKNVALNDIGLITYYGECHVVDFYGLANKEVFEMKRNATFDRAAISRLVDEHHIDAGILYTGWFDDYGGLPIRKLPPAGIWKMEEPNVACAWDTVTFMAPPDKVNLLREELRHFRTQLPLTVKTTYYQLAPANPWRF